MSSAHLGRLQNVGNDCNFVFDIVESFGLKFYEIWITILLSLQFCFDYGWNDIYLGIYLHLWESVNKSRKFWSLNLIIKLNLLCLFYDFLQINNNWREKSQ